jgi:hypothetical protein
MSINGRRTAVVLTVILQWGVFSQAAEPSGGDVASPRPAIAAQDVDQVPRAYFSREFKGAVNVHDYFPLKVGTRWSYRHTSKDLAGPQMAMISVRWIEDIRIVARRKLPEGELILRKTTVRDIKTEHADNAQAEDVEWFRQQPLRLTRTHYLIQGNYVFEVSEYDLDLDRLEWLHDNFTRTVGPREPLPRFFFPMEKVSVWAERSLELKTMEEARLFQAGLGPAPNPANYFWHVLGREEVVVPYGRIKDAVHLHYGTLGGPGEVWFKRGVGIVRETAQRREDFLNREVVLLHFAPPVAKAPRAPPKQTGL